jgi:hypothetical protein
MKKKVTSSSALPTGLQFARVVLDLPGYSRVERTYPIDPDAFKTKRRKPRAPQTSGADQKAVDRPE